jgi:hypothetical protein
MLRVSWCVATLILPVLAHTATAAEVRAVALVLDASGSMKESLPDGVTRMDAARRAVGKLVSTLPGVTRLAFRAYGHQSPTKAKNCKDTELLSPFGSVEQVKDAVVAQANALEPQGYTPISYALQEAANDLSSEEATVHTVVLVSDGQQTCPGDPCAVAKALAEADTKLVMHTIGVGVDSATREQLTCISKAARGMYQDAANTAELEKVVAVAAEAEAVEFAKKPADSGESPRRSPARQSRRRQRSALERSSRDASAVDKTTSGASKDPSENIASFLTRRTLTTAPLALSSASRGLRAVTKQVLCRLVTINTGSAAPPSLRSRKPV